jgi:hypothetical protein
LQTKYLIGIVAIASILLSSLAGFSLAYLSYQPQINNLNVKISAIQTNISALQSRINNLTVEVSNLQRQLNSNVTSLNKNVTDLKNKYGNLSALYSSLHANFIKLEGYVDNISLVYVFKQNNTYYAQNGVNSTIEYSSKNCSSVIEYAFAHVHYGGEVLLKPLALDADAYYIDSTIYPANGTTLASENRVVAIRLDNGTHADAISLYNVHDVQIRNIEIDGNRWNNANGNGIAIESNYSYGSSNLIDNVVIDNCNKTGIWIQQYPVNNVLRNVQVFHSGAYNIEVDSADNQLISVESGWAGLSGFNVRGVDNYFLNCISWGCGRAEDPVDCNGFSIGGARNMFVGCDADRNDRGGFVLANANQTMLTSCIGRNNGQRVWLPVGWRGWGFDLYNSVRTVMSACVATDEQANKTQDYGFTESGNSDYNIVTGCNFDGNRVGAVFDLVGVHSVITDTLGYETKNFGLSNFSVQSTIGIGTNSTFGEETNFTSSKGTITDFHVTIKWDNVASNESVTVKVQALMANGTTTSFKTSYRNGSGFYILTEEDISGLWSGESNSNPIKQLQISAETSENVTAAEVSVFVWGSGS